MEHPNGAAFGYWDIGIQTGKSVRSIINTKVLELYENMKINAFPLFIVNNRIRWRFSNDKTFSDVVQLKLFTKQKNLLGLGRR